MHSSNKLRIFFNPNSDDNEIIQLVSSVVQRHAEAVGGIEHFIHILRRVEHCEALTQAPLRRPAVVEDAGVRQDLPREVQGGVEGVVGGWTPAAEVEDGGEDFAARGSDVHLGEEAVPAAEKDAEVVSCTQRAPHL